MKSALLPCNHLFFFVGGVSTTAQDFGRCGEEVEAVVFKILINQRQKNLREKTFPDIIISAHHIRFGKGFLRESDLGKELDLLLMRRLFHTAAAHNRLCQNTPADFQSFLQRIEYSPPNGMYG